MCSQGHIMGVYIETDMRSDAFDQLENYQILIMQILKLVKSWVELLSDLA